MRELPEALKPLGAYRQFVAFVLVPSRTRPGKTDKFPISCATMTVSSAHDPAAWGTFEQALAVADMLGPGHGVGFVFTHADPFWFLDIDGCLQADGTWSPLALDLVQRTAGAAIEVSSSGTGLHIIGSSPAPVVGFKCKNSAAGLEFYTAERFVALTGISTSGSAAFSPAGLPAAVATYFAPATAGMDSPDWTSGPVAAWKGPSDDADLIERACRSQSVAGAFGARASFADLWTGNVAAMAATWPDPTNAGRPYDASSADAALAQHLAFWTGNDCERIVRLMRQSALVRDKWAREDYLERTILGACARQTSWCDITPREADPQLAEPVEPVAPGLAAALPGGQLPEQRVGLQFLGLEQQQQYFAGCVYVLNAHAIRTPAGALLKPEQFKAYYGGYSFAMDARNVRTVRNAWEALVENQGLRWPRVDDLVFRPDLEPGAIIEEQGQTLVNSWVPIEVPRHPGDATPFLQHMAKLLPDETDRAQLLAYMAAVVQHKGIKFQWCPLVQGVPGNGKTLLSRCVAAAVGQRYVHYPKASEIADKFNDWMDHKIFIAVEDIYVPDASREVLEELKPMITGERQELQGKGKDKQTKVVCCNFMLNSNIKNAVHKTRNDRRFAIFYTAQQSPEDLIRDGMGGNYFPNLYAWLRGDGVYAGQPSGYSIVTDYLMTYPIPAAMNPAALCQIAPTTTSTEEAIRVGAGRIEQEVQEAIECGAPGFCGGWVSSMALDRLIDSMRIGLPRVARRELLEGMGYVRHPGLPDGRVNNTIQPDNGKPRLYIRAGHIHANLTTPAAIAAAYTEAQRPTASPAAIVFNA